MPAGISGNVIRADLERLADLPSEEVAGSAACTGCPSTWGPDTEAPAAGGDDPEEAGGGPEAYEPVLTDEKRLELRRAWLATIRPPAGKAGR